MKRSDKYEILILWSEEKGVFIANAPELQGCASGIGGTREEALAHAESNMEKHISTLKKKGYPIPLPFSERRFSGKLFARVPATLHRDVAFRASVEGLSLNEYIMKKLKEE